MFLIWHQLKLAVIQYSDHFGDLLVEQVLAVLPRFAANGRLTDLANNSSCLRPAVAASAQCSC